MDKNKVKEALKKKLKREISVTGTGASFTSGGDYVATKYAFGKRDNKGTPSDWKPSPSIPNRKSKAMDYKELWEIVNLKKSKLSSKEYQEAKKLKDFKAEDWKWDAKQDLYIKVMNEEYTPTSTNVDELARVEELLAQANRDKSYSVMTAYENRIAILRFIVFLEKKLGKQLPVLKFGRNFGEYLKKELGYTGPIKQNRTGAIANFKTISDTILNNQSQMNEENLEEAYVPENIKKFAQRKGVTNIVNQVSRWAEKAGMKIVGGTAIGKNYDTLILDLTYQGGEVRINCENESIEVNGEPVDDYTSFLSAAEENETLNEVWDFNTGGIKAWDYGKILPKDMEAALSKIIRTPGVTEEDLTIIRNRAQELYNDSRLTRNELNFYKNTSLEDFKEMFLESLNENYARFRNETKTRTKPEQFHTAVKQVKQKVNEINRLFEYMNRLQSELSESEGGLKHKKYTDKAIQSIKESTKQLFFKSTKLK
jgi:hypothetical protein